MQTNDGGPAFPRVITEWDQQPGEKDVTATVTSVGGMTLRDYFAAAALTGIIAAGFKQQTDGATVAKWAFEQAEDMLAAREG